MYLGAKKILEVSHGIIESLMAQSVRFRSHEVSDGWWFYLISLITMCENGCRHEMHVHIGMSIVTYIWGCIEGERTTLRASYHPEKHYLLFKQGLPQARNLLSRLVWLASEPLGSSCVQLPSTGVIMPQSFIVFWGTNTNLHACMAKILQPQCYWHFLRNSHL